MEPYRIFLSSPVDVQFERDRAEHVVKRVNAERVDQRQIEIVRWEHEFYRAEADFQAQIPAPADCDLVICIFWKRLGTELPEKYARPDGTIPTGTEYEFECAMSAAAGRHEKLPDVLVYRKTAPVTFTVDNVELERAQYDRFMAFWQRWFRNEKGHFLAGFQTFPSPDEFEALLDRHLRAWLRDREQDVAWTKGSPYRGLEPFDVEHAPIFFGRKREVERARARLLASAMAGRPFLLITGASGSGKSSLARAGLIPRLGQVGGLSTMGSALRWCILTPGQIVGNWAAGLAERLVDKQAIGNELAQGDFATPQVLTAQLARADSSSPLPLTKALERAGAAIATAEGRASAPNVVLLILVDQLEELFTWPKAEAKKFLELLEALCSAQGSGIWVVATMRSDFQHRLAEHPELERLAGRIELKGPGEAERTLELVLPAMADLREMIVQPARAAGLTFETSPNGARDLAQLLEMEARPEAMPAVQFLLNELYSRRRGNLLTLEAFDALSGVAGVMAQRGEEIYYSIDASARQSFPRVVRALVSQVGSDVPANSRRVPASAFTGDRAASRLLGALSDARIVISDQGVLRFAHDSVLSGWKRLRDQISEEHRLFEARERLEQLCGRWVGGKVGLAKPTKQLLQGFPLAEGRELLAKWGADGLIDRQPELPAFISASDRRDRRNRQLKTLAVAGTASVFVIGGMLYQRQLRDTERARIAADASVLVARSGVQLRKGDIWRAISAAASAYGLLPEEDSRSALAAAMLELSPHLHSTIEIGAQSVEAMTWGSSGTLLYATAERGGRLLELVAHERRPPSDAQGMTIPQLDREQDGNLTKAVALRQLSPDRVMAVLNDGTLALIGQGNAPRLTRLLGADGKPLSRTTFPTAHTAAIGATGALTVVAMNGDDIALIECTLPSLADCRTHALADVRGTAVAISPDEQRFAVGDEEGAVSVYDRKGKRLAKSERIGEKLVSLGWSDVRNWLAAGTAEGDVAIIDAGVAELAVLAKAEMRGFPTTTVAWSPKTAELAFACGRGPVCVWPLTVGSDGTLIEAPARRLEGHSNAVTHLAWSPAGDLMASISNDGTIRTWSGAQNRDAGYSLYAEAGSAQTIVATSPDGLWLGAGDKDGVLRIWELATMRMARREQLAEGSEVVALAWSRSGHVAVALEGGRISVVPADEKKPVRSLEIETGLSARLAWADDDRIIALPIKQEKRVALIDATGDKLQVRRHLGPIGDATPWGVVADRTGKQLLVTFADSQGEVRVFDLATGSWQPMTYTDEVKRDPVVAGSLSVSADGRLLAISGGDSFVRLFDIAARRSWRALPIDANEPHAVAFSPDGLKLAALGADNRLSVWSVRGSSVERLAALSAVPTRAVLADGDSRHQNARWLAWVTNHSIAITSETPAITVIEFDAAQWKRRTDAIAPVPFSQIK